MRYWLVMPAAGAGRRFGGVKQYARLGAGTVLEAALQPFLEDPQCAGGSLALAAEDPHRAQLAERLAPRVAIVTGGVQRAQSVCNGLVALEGRASRDDWVLVHDAARPCLSGADLARLLEQGRDEPVGALLAVPVADTIKRAAAASAAPSAVSAESEGPASVMAAAGASAPVARIEATLAREGLWLAQTPQMFRYAALRAALEGAIAQRRAPTDEAQAMEWRGLAARLVPARDNNLKVTSSADLALAEAILAARSRLACG